MTDSEKGALNLGDMFGKMREFKERIEQMQAQLATETVEAESGGGMVKVVANGRREVVSITIEPEVVDPEDVGMIQDLVRSAVNAALDKAERMMKEKIESSVGSMTGGLLGKLFG